MDKSAYEFALSKYQVQAHPPDRVAKSEYYGNNLSISTSYPKNDKMFLMIRARLAIRQTWQST